MLPIRGGCLGLAPLLGQQGLQFVDAALGLPGTLTFGK
jgi:hypothetical protein